MTNDREEKRLFALHAIGILDTQAEERFDRLTRIASKLFDVPIALVSLVDKDRQWFKSNHGLNIKSTPRTESFCSVAVAEDKLLIVPDTLLDPRFEYNSLVTGEPGIRFYAGCPVKLPDGEIGGTICIIDTEPRTLSEDERSLLKDLAEVVEDEFRIINLAATDSLTGICNRRSFMMFAEETLRKAKKRNRKFSMIIIDLDDFKPINDTWGHNEGNAALVTFASILEGLTDDNSLVARLGGDEFGVISPDYTSSDTAKFINQLTNIINNYNDTSKKPYKILFSAGSVEYNAEKHQSPADLMREADRKMYDIKKIK
ncbi:sensor domain-containing diguanylate cyclase [Rahnella inusitata]|uniref:sensor domain-containing diguanylate cyclase n=1 Tax=Rahnella inusitata TaxID=58169 RepID=UPI001BC82E38|nr:sensor domain-containing diguanylate cyclase [Rahnella inusitata]QUT18104.1 sensor domain-containing diguanylate cyclase [Rahnella inusitata]